YTPVLASAFGTASITHRSIGLISYTPPTAQFQGCTASRQAKPPQTLSRRGNHGGGHSSTARRDVRDVRFTVP
ncbi:MAG TPA: hypothetical protein VIO16_11270, partial [Dehalococcoidia bacterium]